MKHWILAARPKTLFAGCCPVILGTCIALKMGAFHGLSAFSALIGALLIQVGTNFANDYFDFIKGADTAERLGPTRATQAGLIAPYHMKHAFILTFALAALVGLYLISRGGWPIVMIGIASIISGILYTGGPYPLGYLGLGEVFVLLFFGPVAVAGTYYVQALTWSFESVVLGIAAGLFSVAILAVNNLRDRVQDQKVNKRTLAVRFGKTFARWEYLLALVVACLIPPALWGSTLKWISFIPSLTVLSAIPVIQKVWTGEGKTLNECLAKTGQLLLIFTMYVVIVTQLTLQLL